MISESRYLDCQAEFPPELHLIRGAAQVPPWRLLKKGMPQIQKTGTKLFEQLITTYYVLCINVHMFFLMTPIIVDMTASLNKRI
jgi:hypothetical protein